MLWLHILAVLKTSKAFWITSFFKISGALCSCLLPESLKVTTVKQLPEYHACTGLQPVHSHKFSCPWDWSTQLLVFYLSCIFIFIFTEDGSESLASTHESAESDDADEQEKLLLSPSTTSSDVSFIKEIQRWFICPHIDLSIRWSGANSSFPGWCFSQL